MLSSRWSTRVIFAFVFALLTVGCAENRIVDPEAPSAIAAVPTIRVGDARADSLARGLALALGAETHRLQIRDALRDSPYRLHALHLASYLRGEAGTPLAASAAAALGISVGEFLRMSEFMPNLALVMPRALDRVKWDGNAEIDVTATTATIGERVAAKRTFERGYNVSGHVGSVATLRYSRRPYLIVRPAEGFFPADPERVRAAAPVRAWSTVTTPAQERAAMRLSGRERVARERSGGAVRLDASRVSMLIMPCDPMTAIIPCDEDGGGGGGGSSLPGVGGGGATLSSEMTKGYCYGTTSPLDATTDRDNDRIRDVCEEALASRLAPTLNIGNLESVPARQPYWSMSRHPDRPDNTQIIYALAYLRDGGYHGVGAHQGDSEFIIEEVINVTGSRWGIIEATLSAHFGAETGLNYHNADSYYWDDLDYPQGPFPRIWAALEKHANYRNKEICNAGGWGFDSCGGDYIGTQVPAPPTRNLGNYFHVPPASRSIATKLRNCTAWEGPPYMYGSSRDGWECFWNQFGDTFTGWDRYSIDEVTPYHLIFEIFGF